MKVLLFARFCKAVDIQPIVALSFASLNVSNPHVLLCARIIVVSVFHIFLNHYLVLSKWS